MFDLCIFAGTTEGRQLIEFLSDTGLSVYVCVATQYGEALVPRSGNITVSAGRLSQPALEALFSENRFGLVIDATHPYASQATLNISTACSAAGVEYLRLNREVQSHSPGAVYVGSVAEAAAYLNETRGNVLVTTGSKELPAYTRIDDYRRRLYVRVLPAAASIQACEQAGFDPSHIIAMQGPFSKELNKALIRSVNAAFIVSKDAGNNGGFFEKTEAACDEGVVHVIIGRPPQLEGLTLEETIHALCARYGIEKRRQISVIGVGTGAPALLTEEAKNALRTCDCVIGAKRAVEAAAKNKHSYITLDPMKILAFIKAHPEYIRIAVVMSGDTGFYSGAKKLLPALKDFAPNILPGISSLQYFCAKLSLSWDDVHVLSLHGRSGSAARAVREHKKVFVLVGGSGGIRRLCKELTEAGLGGASVSVGERLSYEDEKITTGSAMELGTLSFDPLSVAIIRNPNACPPKRVCFLPDEAFIRSADGAVVPMTKSEIRAVSLSKLMLDEDAVVYDVGAGTGSVSVEMAGVCTRGHVYAVECRKDAAELIRKNTKRFGLANLTVVEGTAPEACRPLPAPTHAFIGGSSGNMLDILRLLTDKNPAVRIVMNLVTLESLADLMHCMKELGYEDAEIIQITVAKSKKLGSHHLMCGQNPITVITCQKTAGIYKGRTGDQSPREGSIAVRADPQTD